MSSHLHYTLLLTIYVYTIDICKGGIPTSSWKDQETKYKNSRRGIVPYRQKGDWDDEEPWEYQYEGHSVGAIIGIVFGTAALITGLSVLTCYFYQCCCSKKKRKSGTARRHRELVTTHDHEDANPHSTSTSSTPLLHRNYNSIGDPGSGNEFNNTSSSSSRNTVGGKQIFLNEGYSPNSASDQNLSGYHSYQNPPPYSEVDPIGIATAPPPPAENKNFQ